MASFVAVRGERLQQLGKWPQLSRSGDQAVACQGLKIFVRAARRIFKAGADLLNGCAKQPLREIQMIAQKLIGMLRVDRERRKRRLGEVFQIDGHDDIAAADMAAART